MVQTNKLVEIPRSIYRICLVSSVGFGPFIRMYGQRGTIVTPMFVHEGRWVISVEHIPQYTRALRLFRAMHKGNLDETQECQDAIDVLERLGRKYAVNMLGDSIVTQDQEDL